MESVNAPTRRRRLDKVEFEEGLTHVEGCEPAAIAVKRALAGGWPILLE